MKVRRSLKIWKKQLDWILEAGPGAVFASAAAKSQSTGFDDCIVASSRDEVMATKH
jgi:hypothetical protein